MPCAKKKTESPEEKNTSLQGILLLLSKAELSSTSRWYVERLAEVYDRSARAPKVQLEILKELREFIIPEEGKKPQQGVPDPVDEEHGEPFRITGTK